MVITIGYWLGHGGGESPPLPGEQRRVSTQAPLHAEQCLVWMPPMAEINGWDECAEDIHALLAVDCRLSPLPSSDDDGHPHLAHILKVRPLLDALTELPEDEHSPIDMALWRWPESWHARDFGAGITLLQGWDEDLYLEAWLEWRGGNITLRYIEYDLPTGERSERFCHYSLSDDETRRMRELLAKARTIEA